MITETDRRYMKSALVLARRGLGKVEPNPAVGCILVKNGQVIGKGYHRRFGEPHAEINALADCQTQGINPQGATVYVTLEPCCHQGKTGPCTQALIQARVIKVVVATQDPAPHAHGAGIRQLRKAGIQVDVGCCQREARLLNAPFFKFAATGQTWIILKWAQSLDGYLAHQPSDDPENIWISNPQSRSDAHRLRRRVQAILVGINTVIADNPRLTPRPSQGRKPLRIVLDSHLQIALTCRLLRTAHTHPTLVVTTQNALSAHRVRAESIRKKGAEVWACPSAGNRPDLATVMAELGRRGIQQVLVEGGPTIHASFLHAGLMDETCIYVAPNILGPHGAADISQAICHSDANVNLDSVTTKSFQNDIRWTGINTQSIETVMNVI